MSTPRTSSFAPVVAFSALVGACGAFSGDEPATSASSPDGSAPDGAGPDASAPSLDGGGVADADAGAAPDPCADQPFREGFEAASIPAPWAASGTTDIDFVLSPDRRASGAQALHVTVQTATIDHGRKLQRPVPGKCVDVTWAMFVPAAVVPDGTTVLTIELGNGEQLFAFIAGARLVLAEQGGGQAQATVGDFPLPTGDFATFHLHLQPGSPGGLRAVVSFSTANVAITKSALRAFADTNTATLAIGAPFAYAGRHGELWFDDVVVR